VTTTTGSSTSSSSTTQPSPASAVVVTRGSTSKRAVALTFDAGSDCGNTARILDILATNAVTATFALTGKWVTLCPALAARIGAAGLPVMNHSFDHPSFTGRSTKSEHLTSAQMIDQVTRAEAAIKASTGRSTLPWFRPPYGDVDSSVNQAVAVAGYRYTAMWTVDSLGWKGTPPAEVVSNVLAKIGNGAIVVMHVGSGSTDVLALQAVIDAIRARGLTFATIGQVL
jgi:peptidoglycan/xylan/chitin deacetylase (PgdA/CDA1 family)